jgi:hypothetical protein
MFNSVLHRTFAVAAISATALLAAAVPATAAPKNTIPGSGTYLVGRDFNAGVYRSTGNTSCYWERAKNASGSFDSIIANDNGGGQRVVYIRPTDKAFKSSGCGTWKRVYDSVLKSKSKRTSLPGEGIYLVGPDFVPGTYRSTGNTTSCYWERSRSADGSFGSIIANENAKGQLVVTISTTDAVFSTSRCKTWTRIG